MKTCGLLFLSGLLLSCCSQEKGSANLKSYVFHFNQDVSEKDQDLLEAYVIEYFPGQSPNHHHLCHGEQRLFGGMTLTYYREFTPKDSRVDEKKMRKELKILGFDENFEFTQ